MELFVYQSDLDGSKKPVANTAIIFDKAPLYHISKYTNSDGIANFVVSAIPGDSLHIRLPNNMFYVPEDTFVVIEEEKKYYDLVIKPV